MASVATRAAPAPSLQEIQRKLSTSRPAKHQPPPPAPIATFSGAESDSDSVLSPDAPASGMSSLSLSTGTFFSPATPTPLSAIVERRTASGEESDEDEDEEEGWRAATTRKDAAGHDAQQQEVRKAGYLWKKGIRRKTWKKRWFVLRFSHLAYYKSSAEYKLLRLLDLHEVHAVTACSLKRHEHTFGIVTPSRTFYLQAENDAEMLDWVQALNEVRLALQSSATVHALPSTTPGAVAAASLPITIPAASPPRARKGSSSHSPLTVSPPAVRTHIQNVTSSDSEEPSPTTQQAPAAGIAAHGSVDPSKPVLSGYLMKCSQKRRNWRKRWFTLTGEKLVYTTSHMDTRPHRVILLTQIVDALEVDVAVPAKYSALAGSPPGPGMHAGAGAGGSGLGGGSGGGAGGTEEGDGSAHTFKVITPKRTLLLCAPSEEEEIRWLSAIQALIARRGAGGAGPALGDGTGRRGGRRLSET